MEGAWKWGDDWLVWHISPKSQIVNGGWVRYQFGDFVACNESGQVVISDVGHRVPRMRGHFRTPPCKLTAGASGEMRSENR